MEFGNGHGLVEGLLGSILFNDNVLLAGPLFLGIAGVWDRIDIQGLGYSVLEFLHVSFFNAFYLLLLHYVFSSLCSGSFLPYFSLPFQNS